MRILASCTCGKQFQAREDLAGKRLPCPACGESIPVPTLEQVAAQAAYVESKKQKGRDKEWQQLRIMVMVGFVCLLLSSLIFPPMLVVCIYLVAIASAVAGIIGNIWLIVHAFSNNDMASGIVMALSFVFPFLWLYTLYYLIKKWDGTAPFILTAGALCGCGILLLVWGVALIAM